MKGVPVFCISVVGILWINITIPTNAFSSNFLQPNHIRNHGTTSPSSLFSSSMFEYEYIPPNEGGSHDFSTTLPSVYPPGTPAGMRGEAVRAALRSAQCLTWKLSQEESPNLACGLLKLQGKGTLDFLNNKLSNSFRASKSNFAKACLLTSKGRLVDTLAIGYSDTEAFIMPSPGHPGAALFQKLDPFIFPMDQVKLVDLSDSSCIFTVASTDLQHVKDAVQSHLIPKLNEVLVDSRALDNFALPEKTESCVIRLDLDTTENNNCLVVLPHTGMPDCALQGYTFAFCDNAQHGGNQVWQHMIGDDNPKGPVEIQALEYDSLRIEAGQPSFGFEVTGAWKEPEITSPTPLELHQKADVIDTEKGCYLGQEGIASVLKNPRGPPRSLYSIVFEDDDNIYQHQSEGDNSKVENLTKMPKAGDKLFVLGSNEEIQVGTITSVAEPYSTGDTTILGLALIRRADSVLKQMKAKDLQIPRRVASNLPSDSTAMDSASGIIPPPPMDSLDGLEIIVGGTFTVGTLRSVPSRRFPNGKNMYVDREVLLTKQEILDQGYMDIEFSGMSPTEFLEEKATELESDGAKGDDVEEEKKASITEPAQSAVADTDDDVEAEARRKAAKMELLKQRAEEATARRRKMKLEAAAKAESNVEETAPDDAEAEAKRKAEKLKLLQQRAEEAIARRRKKKEAQG